jgi:hypothetical protein
VLEVSWWLLISGPRNRTLIDLELPANSALTFTPLCISSNSDFVGLAKSGNIKGMMYMKTTVCQSRNKNSKVETDQGEHTHELTQSIGMGVQVSIEIVGDEGMSVRKKKNAHRGLARPGI